MFRNTKEPSSGGDYLCLAKVTCGSMVQVHVKSVSIVAAYISCNGKSVYLDTYVKNRNMCMLSGSFRIVLVAELPVVCVCTGRCAGGDCTVTCTRTQQLIYADTILTEFTWTCTIEPHVTLARHRCSPPEDGSFVFRNMSGLFLYVILYVFLM